MNTRIRAVIRKEFREYRRNKLVVFTMAALPLVFLGLPIISVLAVPEAASEKAVDAVVGQALLFFLLVPLILPTTIAAYSVIGEREQGTLEPVLTTPATDGELLVGKALAATVPAVLLAWTLFGIFVTVVRVGATEAIVDKVWRPEQFASQILLAPALAAFAIWVGMAISVRSTDIRVAQQLSGLVTLPFVGGAALVSFGIVTPSVLTYVGVAAVMAAVDALGWRATARMFDRERLLTRYGGG